MNSDVLFGSLAILSPDTLGGLFRMSRVSDIAIRRTGIAHPIPHCSRHTSIKEDVHVDGASVADISGVAGHNDLKITLGYVRTADERLHQAVAKLPTIRYVLCTVGERTANRSTKNCWKIWLPGLDSNQRHMD